MFEEKTTCHFLPLECRFPISKEELKEDELQEAFDELWPTWANEMAAMIFTEVLSALDLVVLTATVDNRREIMKIQSSQSRCEWQYVSLIVASVVHLYLDFRSLGM